MVFLNPAKVSLISLFFVSILLFQFLTSCVSPSDSDKNQAFKPQFYIEATGAELKGNKTISVQLPVSASVIQIKPVPSIAHFDIDTVQKAQGPMGPYLQFTLKPNAKLQLMHLSGNYRGRRLVLVVGQTPIGSWRINKVLDTGIVSTFVEVPEDKIPELVQNINDSLKSRSF